MKLNEKQAILTPKVLLVPYTEHHVPTYHEWMQDAELQTATASEPLTLPQEYAMQKSWRTDADKLTFIVCTAPSLPATLNQGDAEDKMKEEENLKLYVGKQDGPDAMIGDINLFLYVDEEEEGDEQAVQRSNIQNDTQSLIGEIEIMIAKKTLHGKGFGKTILLTFLWYIITYLDKITNEYHASHGGDNAGSQLKYLRVKIDAGNTRSIKLFESVGFRKVGEEPNYFGELELRWSVSPDIIKDLEKRLDVMPQILNYP